jgi:hypothetical protein
MLGPSSFHLAPSSKVHNFIRRTHDEYAALDNKPGDVNADNDRVEIRSGKASTQVLLNPSLFSRNYVERVQREDGSVTLREYSLSRLPLSTASGYEVSRSPRGTFAGEKMFYSSGYSLGYYSYNAMNTSEAEQRFHLLEGRFLAEFQSKNWNIQPPSGNVG